MHTLRDTHHTQNVTCDKLMRITKITEFGSKSYFYPSNTEVFTIEWSNGTNPKFYAFGEDRTVRQVDKDYFALNTIGSNYRKIEEQLPAKVESYRTTKDNLGNIYFCFYQESIIHGFDKEGNKFLEWDAGELGQGHAIYDIKYQTNGFIWLAFPSGQTVTQASLENKQETFRIGDYSWEEKYEPLSYPESISLNNNYLYIPNMGHNKLFKVNLESYEYEHVSTFEERLWQYEETNLGTFVITDTGLFEVEDD